MQWKFSNKVIVVVVGSGWWNKVVGFLAIQRALNGFFKIDLIPIKSYFLTNGEYKNENWAKFWTQIEVS